MKVWLYARPLPNFSWCLYTNVENKDSTFNTCMEGHHVFGHIGILLSTVYIVVRGLVGCPFEIFP